MSAIDYPDPTHDLISVNSGTVESSTGDDGGSDTGVGSDRIIPAIVIDSGLGPGGILLVNQMTTSTTFLRVCLSQLRLQRQP